MLSKLFSTRKSMLGLSFIFLLFSFSLLIGFLALSIVPAEAAINCSDSDWSVGTEADLNSAIGCFNGKSTAGTYTITLTDTIGLAASTSNINNSTAGVELLIEGDGFTVNGQNNSGVRPFYIANDSVVTMRNIMISGGNMVNDDGGGIYNRGVLTVTNSTIYGNSAAYLGGGIFNFGGNLFILNSTISNNYSDLGSVGDWNGTTTITNSTISSNINNNRYGVHAFSGGTIRLNNTIIANKASEDDCGGSGTIISDGYNIASDNTCNLSGTGDISNTNPLIGPLQDNGGATLTHALLDGSPALNTGNSTLTEDQRGEARPQDGSNDIGAFERVYVDCASQPWVVTTENNFNDAITCYNSKTIAGTYSISLTQNISLTASLMVINNTTANADLQIDGNNFTVDGQNTSGIRPFEIKADTYVTIQELTIARGAPFNAPGGAVRNSGVLTISHSTLNDNSSTSGGGIFNDGAVTTGFFPAR